MRRARPERWWNAPASIVAGIRFRRLRYAISKVSPLVDPAGSGLRPAAGRLQITGAIRRTAASRRLSDRGGRPCLLSCRLLSVTLEWSASADADSYAVHRDDEELGTVTGLSFSDDEDVQAGAEYVYVIEATNSGGSAFTPEYAVAIPTDVCEPEATEDEGADDENDPGAEDPEEEDPGSGQPGDEASDEDREQDEPAEEDPEEAEPGEEALEFLNATRFSAGEFRALAITQGGELWSWRALPDEFDATERDYELAGTPTRMRSEEHTSELQSRGHLVCRLLLEKKN